MNYGATFGVTRILDIFFVHEVTLALGTDKCVALPMFDAVTRCDTMSVGDRGKKAAWDTLSDL